MVRRKNLGLGCPRCGGSTTRVSGIVSCRKCDWREGLQAGLDHWRTPAKIAPREEPPPPLDYAYPGKRRVPLKF